MIDSELDLGTLALAQRYRDGRIACRASALDWTIPRLRLLT
jgi:hypothetical protein